MHADVIQRFFSVQAVLMAPITPHFCEHVWGTLLKLTSVAPSVTRAPWPAVSASREASAPLLAMDRYLADKVHLFRVQITKATVGKPGKARVGGPAPKPTHATLYVATRYTAWQEAALRVLAPLYDAAAHPRDAGYFPADALARIKAAVAADAALKPLTKRVMEFASQTIAAHRERAPEDGPAPALRLAVPFDEAAAWAANAVYVCKALELTAFTVRGVEEEGVVAGDASGRAKDVVLGEPAMHAYLPAI